MRTLQYLIFCLTSSTLSSSLAGTPAFLEPATQAETRSVFKEVAGLPGINLANLPECSKELLQPYRDDRMDTELRVTLREAIRLFQNRRRNLVIQFNTPAPNQVLVFKQGLIRAIPALTEYNLIVLVDELRLRAAQRNMESKRWQAIYDYVCARLEKRIGYMYEYHACMTELRRKPPPLDPKKHAGWQFVRRAEISNRDALKRHASARKYLIRIIEEHAGTPWATVAKRELATPIGLECVPLPRRK